MAVELHPVNFEGFSAQRSGCFGEVDLCEIAGGAPIIGSIQEQDAERKGANITVNTWFSQFYWNFILILIVRKPIKEEIVSSKKHPYSQPIIPLSLTPSPCRIGLCRIVFHVKKVSISSFQYKGAFSRDREIYMTMP